MKTAANTLRGVHCTDDPNKYTLGCPVQAPLGRGLRGNLARPVIASEVEGPCVSTLHSLTTTSPQSELGRGHLQSETSTNSQPNKVSTEDKPPQARCRSRQSSESSAARREARSPGTIETDPRFASGQECPAPGTHRRSRSAPGHPRCSRRPCVRKNRSTWHTLRFGRLARRQPLCLVRSHRAARRCGRDRARVGKAGCIPPDLRCGRDARCSPESGV